MSKTLIVVLGLIYLSVAVHQFLKGNPIMGWLFATYALTNIPYYYLVD